MSETVRYQYRLKPVGSVTMLTLLPQHLKADRGANSFTIAYRDIAAIWLSFMPRGAYLNGFRTKIYVKDRKTITLDDSTYASLFTQERQGPEYRAFVLALIERAKAANPQVQIMAGRNFWMQAASAIFGVVFGALLPVMGIMTLGAGQWPLGLMFLAFAAVFVWWTWKFIRLNRLRDIKSAVPEDLLPPIR